MYDEDIEALSEWMNEDERAIDTNRIDDDFFISQYDVDDFCNFIREIDPDLIGIKCTVTSCGIWFDINDLQSARHY
ncbi:MAG: hypothetical protein J6S67_20505 [Methanobrevibacter sp.]|nr:hypothetical protein [Methanobrevibacter sp.]